MAGENGRYCEVRVSLLPRVGSRGTLECADNGMISVMPTRRSRTLLAVGMGAIAVVALLTCLEHTALAADSPADSSVQRLTLEEALGLALKHNPDVIEAQSRLSEADARLRAARASAWPTLKLRGTYDYWNDDQRLLPATSNGEPGVFGQEIAGAEVTASWALYTGGRLSSDRESARWSRDAASDNLARARETLAYQVTAAFYGLLAQREVVRSLEAAVLSMDEQQLAVGAMLEVGKAARVDLLRVGVRRAELQERLLRERSNEVVQEWAWAALLGLDGTAVPRALGALEMERFRVCPDPTECLKMALAQRADYRAAKAIVAATEAALRAARAGYGPTLSVQASLGERWMLESADEPGPGGAYGDLGRVGLVLEMPLFDGRLTSARVAEQKARLAGARERLRKTELQIRFEVEAALSDIVSSEGRVSTTHLGIQQAEESYRIMTEKYDLGKGTMTDVLDAQAALVTAETNCARALADLATSVARGRLAVGETLP